MASLDGYLEPMSEPDVLIDLLSIIDKISGIDVCKTDPWRHGMDRRRHSASQPARPASSSVSCDVRSTEYMDWFQISCPSLVILIDRSLSLGGPQTGVQTFLQGCSTGCTGTEVSGSIEWEHVICVLSRNSASVGAYYWHGTRMCPWDGL